MYWKVCSTELKGWYPNGHTRDALNVGDVRDFGDAASGLAQAGLIEPVLEVKAPEKAADKPAEKADKAPEKVEAIVAPETADKPLETVIEKPVEQPVARKPRR